MRVSVMLTGAQDAQRGFAVVRDILALPVGLPGLLVPADDCQKAGGVFPV